ncbi:MAG: response regulator [Desulfobacterales bacterium]|nr:response regulator [Desulfobacterales bacterium]
MGTIAAARSEGRNGYILVADDDDALCDNLKEVLTAGGYCVAVAHDGQAAIDMAQQQSFDLLLLDLKLPEVAGLEVYRRIKERQPNLTTILITGYAGEMRDVIGQALNESAYTFMTKPLKMERLLELVDEVARTRKSDATC